MVVTDPPETHYTLSRGASIAYQVVGDGPLDLVFFFGHESQLDMLWDAPASARFLQRLASFSRLILYDERGVGLSGGAMETFSFEEGIADFRAVLQAIGTDAVAHFSCCDSGRMSIVFAAMYPDQTSALTLFESPPATLRDDDYPFGAEALDNERHAEDIASGWGDEGYQTSSLRRLAPTAAKDPHARRWWARMRRAAGSPAEMAMRERTFRDIDVRYALPTIRVPTLILHRTGSRGADVGASRYMAERIPGARFVELEGRDHLPMFGDADALVDEVETFLTGVRSPRMPDRVLATVLFTDIVDSTRKASELGDRRWRELLDRHNDAVRTRLSRFGGEEINTTGDGFVALFHRPTSAIRCAQTLIAETPQLGIELRAGIHTGECERTGHDIAGIAVHIAARVSGLARPGELLVSRTVQDLVAGSGIKFDDRGEPEMKGVPGTWRLYAVEG